jgi:C-terminal processing protease CtpA/Prc
MEILRAFLVSMLLLPLASTVAEEEPVQLEPWVVKEDPINSFGFQLMIVIDRDSKKIVRAFVGEVIEGSSAHRSGLQPSDEVVKINGRPLAGMAAHVSPDSELGRLIIARRAGTMIDLEVISPRARKLVITAEESPANMEPMNVDEDSINRFGFQLKIAIDRDSSKIVRAFCDDIVEGSSAHRSGLLPKDEVVKINGNPLAGMEARIGPDSELGRLLIAQHDGTMIDLEVISKRTRKLVITAGR